jgi:integrase
MAKSHLRLVAPAILNRTVTPRRRPNADLRTREHLTEAEVERLMEAAKRNRWGHRDATMIVVAYRHGLRASELVDLRWDQVEFGSGALHIRRVKRGTPSTHPIPPLGVRDRKSRSTISCRTLRGRPVHPAKLK